MFSSYVTRCSSSHTICCKSAVQNRMPVAGEERYIDEEGKADAEEVADDQADEEGCGGSVAVDWSKSVGSNAIR